MTFGIDVQQTFVEWLERQGDDGVARLAREYTNGWASIKPFTGDKFDTSLVERQSIVAGFMALGSAPELCQLIDAWGAYAQVAHMAPHHS